MSERINYQVIEQDGKPAFAVVPYEEFMALIEGDDPGTPHEVVKIMVANDCSLIAAWRQYKKMSQYEVAQKMGISQPAYAKMEKNTDTLRRTTLSSIAKALDVEVIQLAE
jgi:DNA-binding XRE family transcriptional regulator